MAYTLTSNVNQLLNQLNQEAFLDGFISEDADLSWIQVIPTDKNQVINVGVNPPGQYSTSVEGQDIATQAVEESFASTYNMTGVSLGFSVSLQTKLTMEPGLLASYFQQMGASARRRVISDAFGVLDQGTAGAGPDGQPLFSASHPTNVGVASNKATTALDYASYEIAQRALVDQQTADGLVAGYKADTLIVPSALNVLANKVNTAIYQDAAYMPNISNTMGIKTIVSSDLPSSNSRWFLLDSRFSSIKMYVLKGSSPVVTEQDPKSLRYIAVDKMIYGTGFDTWRGTFTS